MTGRMIAIAALLGVGALASAHAGEPMKLTAQDYIDIKQLSARYAQAIQECTENGYGYADLFVSDGEFAVTSDWGVPPTRIARKGREQLAELDGGGAGGCRDAKTMMSHGLTDIVTALVITPTETGARGKAQIEVLGVGNDPTRIESQGGYEDTYVKTPQGWRIKTRWHVFPNMATSVQFGPGSKFGQRGNAGAPTSGK